MIFAFTKLFYIINKLFISFQEVNMKTKFFVVLMTTVNGRKMGLIIGQSTELIFENTHKNSQISQNTLRFTSNSFCAESHGFNSFQ